MLAVVLAALINRYFSHRAQRIAEAVTRGEINPGLDTRLRFLRRLLIAAILLVGVAIAMSQFTGLSKIAASVLASGALAAAIIGFAARQTLANGVAGVMLAITQPLRVGDWVTFEEHYGVVEDVRLNFTILRTPADQRVIIPNERLATGVLRNDTLMSDSIGLDVAIWLPTHVDAERAVAVLQEETQGDVAVAEVVPWGVRLSVGDDPVPPPQRARREAELRAQCLRRLRAEGLADSEEQGIEPS